VIAGQGTNILNLGLKKGALTVQYVEEGKFPEAVTFVDGIKGTVGPRQDFIP